MHYSELPKEFQEWGKKIEQEFAQTLADEAMKFQASEAEAGRVVSITDAVHHVKTAGFGIFPGDTEEAPNRARQRAASSETEDEDDVE